MGKYENLSICIVLAMGKTQEIVNKIKDQKKRTIMLEALVLYAEKLDEVIKTHN